MKKPSAVSFQPSAFSRQLSAISRPAIPFLLGIVITSEARNLLLFAAATTVGENSRSLTA
jgi:hypothetical protein